VGLMCVMAQASLGEGAGELDAIMAKFRNSFQRLVHFTWMRSGPISGLGLSQESSSD
jgi:hypothetical protein